MAKSQDRLPQTLGEHIGELRSRLTKTALLFVLGAAVGYAFHQYFIDLLKRPLHEKIYYTSPAGGFNFVMKVCLVFGLVVALPALIYNLIEFIRPAFKREISRTTVRVVTLMSLVLALGGAAFAFLVVVPGSLHFFSNFSNGVQPLISASDYLSFVINCVISFMVIFQAPLIILFIDHIKPLTPKKLLSMERYVIVGSLASALVLPFTYDPTTQFMISLPIIALYNLSIVFVAITHARRQRARKDSVVSLTPVEAIPVDKPAPVRTKSAPHKTWDVNFKPVPQQLTQPAKKKSQQPAITYTRRQVMDIMPRASAVTARYNPVRNMPLAEAE